MGGGGVNDLRSWLLNPSLEICESRPILGEILNEDHGVSASESTDVAASREARKLVDWHSSLLFQLSSNPRNKITRTIGFH